MSKLTDEKLNSMCPRCRGAAHEWIVDVVARAERINAASNRRQLLAFLLGAATTLTVIVIIAACQR